MLSYRHYDIDAVFVFHLFLVVILSFFFFFFELVIIQLSSCLGGCIFSLVFSIILCHSKGGIIKYG